MAIAPSGVYVIDAKRYNNAKVAVRRTGGLFAPVREQLMVNSRDRTKLLDSVARQVAAARAAVATFSHEGRSSEDIEIKTILSFVDAYLPSFGTPHIAGVPLLGAKGTAKVLRTSPGPLDERARAALHRHLAVHLPPA